MFENKIIIIFLPAILYGLVTILLILTTKYLFYVWMTSSFFKLSLVSILVAHTMTNMLTKKKFVLLNSIIASIILLFISVFIYFILTKNMFSPINVVWFLSLGFLSVFIDKKLSEYIKL